MTNFIKEELDKFDEEFGGQKFVYANENWVTASHLRLLERRVEYLKNLNVHQYNTREELIEVIINELKSIEQDEKTKNRQKDSEERVSRKSDTKSL